MAQKELQQSKAAAIKIQAAYRGYRTRKFLLNQKEIENMENDPFLWMSEIVNDLVISSTTDDKVCICRN